MILEDNFEQNHTRHVQDADFATEDLVGKNRKFEISNITFFITHYVKIFFFFL